MNKTRSLALNLAVVGAVAAAGAEDCRQSCSGDGEGMAFLLQPAYLEPQRRHDAAGQEPNRCSGGWGWFDLWVQTEIDLENC